MKILPYLIFAFPLFLSFGFAPDPALTTEFWNSPPFVRSFMGSYGFRSEIEPRINKSEQFILGEVVAKSENQIEDAISYLEQKIDEESSAAIDFALATMYYQVGRLSKSAQTYEKALQKFPSFLRARKNLGFVYLSLGSLDKASKSLSEAISLGENDGVTYVALGYCHLSQNLYLAAENAYRMGILLYPESKDARNGLVNCLLSTGRYPEALSLLNELIEKDPENTFCHYARASALQGMDREKDAVIALETLRRMGQIKTSALITSGDLYHNLGLYDISLSRYQEALANKEKLTSSQFVRVARILIQRGSYEDGFSYLRQIEQTFGASFSAVEKKEVLLLQAEVLKATGKSEEAASLLRQIVEANPLEGKALILLGQHAWNEDNYTQASLFFERATRVKEWEVRALIEHARMSVANREYDDAVRMLEEAQTISPQPRVERYLKSIQNLLLSSRLKF